MRFNYDQPASSSPLTINKEIDINYIQILYTTLIFRIKIHMKIHKIAFSAFRLATNQLINMSSMSKLEELSEIFSKFHHKSVMEASIDSPCFSQCCLHHVVSATVISNFHSSVASEKLFNCIIHKLLKLEAFFHHMTPPFHHRKIDHMASQHQANFLNQSWILKV